MTALTITSVLDPTAAERALRVHLGHDESFIKEVARKAGVEATFIEGRLADVAPPTGFVLWSAHGNDVDEPLRAETQEQSLDLVARFATRLVQIDASTSRIFAKLERLNLAAVIDFASHSAWARPDRASAARQGLYGRRDIAALIGADCDGGDGSARYAFITSARHEGLAHLLADYLVALHGLREAPAR